MCKQCRLPASRGRKIFQNQQLQKSTLIHFLIPRQSKTLHFEVIWSDKRLGLLHDMFCIGGKFRLSVFKNVLGLPQGDSVHGKLQCTTTTYYSIVNSSRRRYYAPFLQGWFNTTRIDSTSQERYSFETAGACLSARWKYWWDPLDEGGGGWYPMPLNRCIFYWFNVTGKVLIQNGSYLSFYNAEAPVRSAGKRAGTWWWGHLPLFPYSFTFLLDTFSIWVCHCNKMPKTTDVSSSFVSSTRILGAVQLCL